MSVKKGQSASLDIQLAGATAPVTATISGVALATAPAIVSGTLDTYRFALSATETNASIVTIVARDALSLEWGIVISTDETDHAAIASTNAKAANLPADPASNTAVNTRQASASFAADSRAALGLAAANLDAQISGISSKTANLPATPASKADADAATAAANAAKASADLANRTAPDNANIAAIAGKMPATIVAAKSDVDAVGATAATLPTLAQMEASSKLSHTPTGWVLVTDATAGMSKCQDDATPPNYLVGVLIEAFLASDTGFTTIINSTYSTGGGSWAIPLPSASTYTLRFSLAGQRSMTVNVTV